MKKNKEKYDSFGEFILNDNKKVMPFLITLSIWGGFVIISLIFIGTMYSDVLVLKILFGLTWLASLRKCYQFIKFKGSKAYKGMTANNMVFNNKYKVVKK
jgi:hypothetical protein